MTNKSPLVEINPETGDIFRLLKNGTRRPAGYFSPRGYRYISVNNRTRAAHQLVWEYVYGNIPEGLEIDHIDGDPSNNSISNLRLVTHTQNMQNQHRPRGNNRTSGVKGVHWDSGRGMWRTHIVVNGHQKFIGRFTTIEDAGRAYAEAAAMFHTHNPSSTKVVNHG